MLATREASDRQHRLRAEYTAGFCDNVIYGWIAMIETRNTGRQRSRQPVGRLQGNYELTLTAVVGQNGHSTPLGPRSWLRIFHGKRLNTHG